MSENHKDTRCTIDVDNTFVDVIVSTLGNHSDTKFCDTHNSGCLIGTRIWSGIVIFIGFLVHLHCCRPLWKRKTPKF